MVLRCKASGIDLENLSIHRKVVLRLLIFL